MQITEQKTGNDVSEFTHLNWIMLSYYSGPKHKSLIPRYLIHSFHFNLNYTTSFVKIQIRSEATSHAISIVIHTKLDQTGLNWPQPTKVGIDVILRC